jgi:RHS repeat-associated protein
MVTDGFVTLIYDGDGNRVSETVGGVTTDYLVDTQNPTAYAQVVDELQSGTVARAYSFGLERISETQTLNSVLTTSFYGYDGHGSVRQLTNTSGAATDTYDYDAFGNMVNSAGSTPNNYLFAGEQHDPALGVYYNRARYLNTTTGRFWSMDTYEGDPQSPMSLHKYLYASGDPVDRRDPSGNDDVAEEVGTASIDLALSAAFSAVLYNVLYQGGVFLSQTSDPTTIPLAVASAIQQRAFGPGLKAKLDQFQNNYVFFVHGTSQSSADDINIFGVDRDKSLASGKGSLVPGAFFTLLLEPNPITAIELASGFAQAKPSPHAIAVGEPPLGVFQSLQAGGQAVTRPINGAGYDETYFLQPSFPTLDSFNLGRWGIAPIP